MQFSSGTLKFITIFIVSLFILSSTVLTVLTNEHGSVTTESTEENPLKSNDLTTNKPDENNRPGDEINPHRDDPGEPPHGNFVEPKSNDRELDRHDKNDIAPDDNEIKRPARPNIDVNERKEFDFDNPNDRLSEGMKDAGNEMEEPIPGKNPSSPDETPASEFEHAIMQVSVGGYCPPPGALGLEKSGSINTQTWDTGTVTSPVI